MYSLGGEMTDVHKTEERHKVKRGNIESVGLRMARQTNWKNHFEGCARVSPDKDIPQTTLHALKQLAAPLHPLVPL